MRFGLFLENVLYLKISCIYIIYGFDNLGSSYIRTSLSNHVWGSMTVMVKIKERFPSLKIKQCSKNKYQSTEVKDHGQGQKKQLTVGIRWLESQMLC